MNDMRSVALILSPKTILPNIAAIAFEDISSFNVIHLLKEILSVRGADFQGASLRCVLQKQEERRMPYCNAAYLFLNYVKHNGWAEKRGPADSAEKTDKALRFEEDCHNFLNDTA